MIAVGLIIFFITLTYPRNIHFIEQGIKYRLGEENVGTERPTTVEIEGKLYRSLTGNKTFIGTIEIEGEEINVPVNQRKLEVLFFKGNSGVISCKWSMECRAWPNDNSPNNF